MRIMAAQEQMAKRLRPASHPHWDAMAGQGDECVGRFRRLNQTADFLREPGTLNLRSLRRELSPSLNRAGRIGYWSLAVDYWPLFERQRQIANSQQPIVNSHASTTLE